MVDPVQDEMLAKFVVDSHFKSQPKGGTIDDKSIGNSQEEVEASGLPADTEVHYGCLDVVALKCLKFLSIFISKWCPSCQVLPQDLLKKYLTYAKLNVFPRLHDADLNKLAQVYAELRRESSVRFSYLFFVLVLELLMIVVHHLIIFAFDFMHFCSMGKEFP